MFDFAVENDISVKNGELWLHYLYYTLWGSSRKFGESKLCNIIISIDEGNFSCMNCTIDAGIVPVMCLYSVDHTGKIIHVKRELA